MIPLWLSVDDLSGFSIAACAENKELKLEKAVYDKREYNFLL